MVDEERQRLVRAIGLVLDRFDDAHERWCLQVYFGATLLGLTLTEIAKSKRKHPDTIAADRRRGMKLIEREAVPGGLLDPGELHELLGSQEREW